MKNLLRKQFKELRLSQSEDQLLQSNQRIIENTLSFVEFLSLPNRDLKIAGYFPINNEVDCFELLKHLDRRLGQRTDAHTVFFLPWIANFAEAQMKFFPILPSKPLEDQNLIPGKFGYQPVNKITTDEPLLDVVFAPLVAFDEHLNRLGYGKGFYDRYFNANKPSLKIGLAFEFQKLPASASEIFLNDPTNVPLDYIITELEIYKRSKS